MSFGLSPTFPQSSGTLPQGAYVCTGGVAPVDASIMETPLSPSLSPGTPYPLRNPEVVHRLLGGVDGDAYPVVRPPICAVMGGLWLLLDR
jgi:hypothetical protein